MGSLSEVNRCEVCGNMTGVFHASGGTMACSGKPNEASETPASSED